MLGYTHLGVNPGVTYFVCLLVFVIQHSWCNFYTQSPKHSLWGLSTPESYVVQSTKVQV